MGTEYPSSEFPIGGQSRAQKRVTENLQLNEEVSLLREIIKEQFLLIEELSSMGRPFHVPSDPRECVPSNFVVAPRMKMVHERDLNTRPLRSAHSLGLLHCFNTRTLEIMRDLDANENASTGYKVPTWENVMADLEDLAAQNQ